MVTEKKPKDKEPGFDTLMEELEEAVGKLESGDLPLEEAFAQFQRGMEVQKLCSERLEAMEKKIEILLKNAKGEPETRDAD